MDKVITKRLDDLHAREGHEVPAEHRTTFGMGGETYQIDLTEENRKAFEELISPYVDAATKVSNGARPKSKKGKSTPHAPAIRAWAAEEGIVLKDKGPLPREVKEQYAAANGLSVDDLK